MGVAAEIQLNQFELDLLEYVFRNPGAPSQQALEKTRVDRGSGSIALRYMARLGLITAGEGSWSDKKLMITDKGLETLRYNGLAK